MSILALGSVALDTLRTPRETREDLLGGSAPYFALAASRYAPVRLVAAVGTDFPARLRAPLERKEIDRAGLEVLPGTTFRWSASYGEDPNVRTTDELEFGVLNAFRPVLPEGWGATRFIFLGNDHPARQLHVLGQTARNTVAICDTIDFYIETDREDVLNVLRSVEGAILNDREARKLTGETNTVAAARALLSLGPRFAVVKKGEHGALLAHGSKVYAVPAWPLENVVDPTGAGDAFAGGLVGFLASRNASDLPALREGLAYGTAAASFACERFGVEALAAASRAEIGRRARSFKALCAIP